MEKGNKKYNGKQIRFTIRFTKEEADELQKNASKKNMTISEYIRDIVKKNKK